MKEYRHLIGVVAGVVVAFLLWSLFDLVFMPVILGIIVFVIVVLFYGEITDHDDDEDDWY